MRALRLEIFKSHFGDCSNHGISEYYNEILLVCPDGNIEVDRNDLPKNLCIIDEILGHKFARPYAEPTGVGWMAGGAIVYSCDSRFRRMSEYPLTLHDRQETQKEYDMYSE